MELEENILASSKEKKSKQKPWFLLLIIYLVHICLWIIIESHFNITSELGTFFDGRRISLFIASFSVGLFYTLLHKELIGKKALIIVCLYACIIEIIFISFIISFPKPLIQVSNILKNKSHLAFWGIICFLYPYIQILFDIIFQYLYLIIGSKLGIQILNSKNKNKV